MKAMMTPLLLDLVEDLAVRLEEDHALLLIEKTDAAPPKKKKRIAADVLKKRRERYTHYRDKAEGEGRAEAAAYWQGRLDKLDQIYTVDPAAKSGDSEDEDAEQSKSKTAKSDEPEKGADSTGTSGDGDASKGAPSDDSPGADGEEDSLSAVLKDMRDAFADATLNAIGHVAGATLGRVIGKEKAADLAKRLAKQLVGKTKELLKRGKGAAQAGIAKMADFVQSYIPEPDDEGGEGGGEGDPPSEIGPPEGDSPEDGDEGDKDDGDAETGDSGVSATAQVKAALKRLKDKMASTTPSGRKKAKAAAAEKAAEERATKAVQIRQENGERAATRTAAWAEMYDPGTGLFRNKNSPHVVGVANRKGDLLHWFAVDDPVLSDPEALKAALKRRDVETPGYAAENRQMRRTNALLECVLYDLG